MPTIVALPDGREVEVPDDASPEQRAALKTKLRERYTAEQDGPLERAGSYIAKRGKSFIGALNRLTGLPGQADPSVGQVASDVLEVGGPVLAPGLTAAGAVAGAGARALGASEDTAQMVDAGTALAGGVGQAAKAAWKAGTGGRQALRAGGEELLWGKGDVRGKASAATAAFQARTYDPIAREAAKRGLGITAGTPEGTKLGQALLDAESQWGPLMGSAEHRTVTQLVDRLTQGSATISYQELDDAMKGLLKVRGPSSVKMALDQAAQDALAGTPLAPARAAAQAEYARSVIPMRRLATTIGKARSPQQAMQRAISLWDEYPDRVRQMLDPTGETAALVQTLKPMVSGMSTRTSAMLGGAAGLLAASDNFARGDFSGGLTQLVVYGGLAGGLARFPSVVKAAAGGVVPGAAAAGSAAVSGSAPNTAAEPRTAPQTPAPSPSPQPEAKAAPTASYPFQREIETALARRYAAIGGG